MAAKLFVLFACVVLAQARLVRRDATAAAILQDIEKHATDMQKTMTEQWNALVNSKNTEAVNKAVKDGTDALLKQLSTFSESLQGALGDANGKAKAALEQTHQNLEKMAAELRKAHPDVEKQAGELREKMQAVVQNTLQETQKLAKEVAANMEQTNQKLAPKMKEAYEDFVKQAEAIRKKVHEAATKQ